MHFALEYGGGLGDIFTQLYHRGSYNLLQQLQPGDTADVYLVTHNPYARELFTLHPKANQLTVHDLGYWPPADDAAMRRIHQMPPAGMNGRLPSMPPAITFYPTSHDAVALDTVVGTRYVVVAPSAGTADRFIPCELLAAHILPGLVARGLTPVLVGRTYDRAVHDPAIARQEFTHPDYPGVLNFVDRLSVPGTAALLQQATGVVTAHSALCLLGWLEHTPMLLLYPDSVLAHHAPNGRYDAWMAGAVEPHVRHTTFAAATAEWLRGALDALTGH